MIRRFLAAIVSVLLCGSIGFAQTSNGRVTAAAPTYTNNSTAPLSLSTGGLLRTVVDSITNAIQVVGNVASGAADSGNPVKVGGIFQTTPSTVTNGQRSNVQVDANGNQRFTPVAPTVTAADNIANTAVNGTLPPASSTVATQLWPQANYVFDGSTWDRMPGTSAGGVSTTVIGALPAGTNNIGDVDVLTLPSIPAGTNNIGDVDVLTLPSIPAGTNNIGDVDVLTLPNITIGAVAQTAFSGTASTAATVIKASAGTLYSVNIIQGSTTLITHFYDNASACSGTIRFSINQNTIANNAVNFGMVFVPPIAFSSGITACTSTGTQIFSANYQ